MSKKAPFGSTRGPVSVANYACGRHKNCRYSAHQGTFNLLATRAIAVGDAITASYSTNVPMTCHGCA